MRHVLSALVLSLAPVAPQADTPATVPIPVRVVGRTVPDAESDGYRRQWPGTYFEAAFDGPAVDVRTGAGDMILRVRIDADRDVRMVRPHSGLHRFDRLGPGPHRIRVDIVSESRDAATSFGGFVAPPGTRPLPPPPARPRRIEFIGDSHTVGYANQSQTRECARETVWATTDTSRGVAGIVAAHYDADYRVHAISGRGIVRNYAGGAGDTLPAAYPFALLDHTVRADDRGWQPQVLVVSLGTNDFSTPPKTSERYGDPNALRRAYHAGYVDFLRGLRARHPGAFILLWATDIADGQVAQQTAAVAKALRDGGERLVAFATIPNLTFAACDHHPDQRDDATIANALTRVLDAHGAMPQ